MRDLIKAAVFVAMVSGGADAGQHGVAARFLGFVKGDVARPLGAIPIAYSAGRPVRFGW